MARSDPPTDPSSGKPLADEELYALWVIHRAARRVVWQQPGFEGFGEAFFYEGWFTYGGRNPYPPMPADDLIKTLIERDLLRSVGERLLGTDVQLAVEQTLDVPVIPPCLIMVVSETGRKLLADLPDWQRRALARFYDGPPAPGASSGGEEGRAR